MAATGGTIKIRNAEETRNRGAQRLQMVVGLEQIRETGNGEAMEGFGNKDENLNNESLFK